jgi:hypothetical protein
MKRFSACHFLVLSLGALLLGQAVVRAQQPSPIQIFWVSTDQMLTYPNNLVDIPDEHTTFIPNLPDVSASYLVFASSKIRGGLGGAVVLETNDLQTFTYATVDGYADQVMAPPIAFTTCDPTYRYEFDENYAAPGSVLQDPTLPEGSLLMLYEAENHCPDNRWQQPYYATIGVARSSDAGRTWPSPYNSEFGGPDRAPRVKGPNPEPPVEPNPAAMGDALPSAFVDIDKNGQMYLYVVYNYAVGPSGPSDGLLRIARAELHSSNALPTFWKWYNNSFSQPGIGGMDTSFLPVGNCPGRQVMGSLSYNDDLGLYVMIFVCNSFSVDGYGAWYYSTAPSLDSQDWAPPQLIAGSRKKITAPCNTNGSGSSFDGFYPSIMSPGAAAGHTRLTGKVFFLNGCDTGLPRAFESRDFTIVP